MIKWAMRHRAQAAVLAMAVASFLTLAAAIYWRGKVIASPVSRIGQRGLFALGRTKTMYEAYALMEKGKYAMAREIFGEAIRDAADEEELQAAELGLKLLAQIEKQGSQGVQDNK